MTSEVRSTAGYGRVPRWLFGVEGVSPRAYQVYAALDSHTTGNGVSCYPGRDRLALMCGCSVRTIADALAELVAAGAVTITRRRGSSDYLLHLDAPSTAESTPRDGRDPALLDAVDNSRRAESRLSEGQNLASQIGRKLPTEQEVVNKTTSTQPPTTHVVDSSTDRARSEMDQADMSGPDSPPPGLIPIEQVRALAGALADIDAGEGLVTSVDEGREHSRRPWPPPAPVHDPGDPALAAARSRIRARVDTPPCPDCGQPLSTAGRCLACRPLPPAPAVARCEHCRSYLTPTGRCPPCDRLGPRPTPHRQETHP